MELNQLADISSAVTLDISTALFEMLKNYPFSAILSLVAILLVISFFVTSSDSGSLVIDFITTGGKLDAPVGTRVFWALVEGLLAISLLIGGGLSTLQTAVMLAAFPYAIILLVMTFSLIKVQSSQFEKLIEDMDDDLEND